MNSQWSRGEGLLHSTSREEHATPSCMNERTPSLKLAPNVPRPDGPSTAWIVQVECTTVEDFAPARVIPLNITADASPWSDTILKLSWTIHLLILCTLSGLHHVASMVRREALQPVLTSYVLLAATFMVDCSELYLYNQPNQSGVALRPGFFVLLQTLKAALWSFDRSHGIRLLYLQWSSTLPFYRVYDLLLLVGVLLAHFATLGYAILVTLRTHKSVRKTLLGHQSPISTAGILPVLEHLAYPVNQAGDLKDSSPTMARLLMWLYAQTDAHGISGKLYYCFSYILVALIGVFLLSTSSRLPGEPQHPGGFGDQDYVKIRVDPDQGYLDDPTRPSHDQERFAVGSESWSLRSSRQSTSGRAFQDRGQYPARGRRNDFPLRRARLLGPKNLCFVVNDSDSDQGPSYETSDVASWVARNHGDNDASYVFISYTRNQFYTQVHIESDGSVEDADLRQGIASRDKALLVEFAIKAANAANVPAFWIDFECIRAEEERLNSETVEEVYRICDIARAAHSMAIVLAPSLESNPERDIEPATNTEKADWLRDWGTRLWTVPEALLAPSEHRIMIFALGTDEPERVAKRNLAGRAYDHIDAEDMQQLVDYYEGSLPLTPLQFISLALECLHRRRTTKRMAGDVSYALQGLLSQRPRVNSSESDFQAFARLSLANDSDRLLERLLCLCPSTPSAPWHDMSDKWGAKLWNIVPSCEVVDIIDERCISLDAFAAAINWSQLEPVDYEVAGSTPGLPSWRSVRASSAVTLILGLIVFVLLPLHFPSTQRVSHDTVFSEEPVFRAQWPVLVGFECAAVLCFLLCTAMPAAIKQLLQCKIANPQARFFGVEGHADLGAVERNIFGSDHKRMTWIDSSDWPTDHVSQNRLRLFTLIDTFKLTATSYSATEPPTAVICCGREKGLTRALLCSYDSASSMFTRECTIRMEADVLTRMQWVQRLRFAVEKS